MTPFLNGGKGGLTSRTSEMLDDFLFSSCEKGKH